MQEFIAKCELVKYGFVDLTNARKYKEHLNGTILLLIALVISLTLFSLHVLFEGHIFKENHLISLAVIIVLAVCLISFFLLLIFKMPDLASTKSDYVLVKSLFSSCKNFVVIGRSGDSHADEYTLKEILKIPYLVLVMPKDKFIGICEQIEELITELKERVKGLNKDESREIKFLNNKKIFLKNLLKLKV